MPSSNLQRTVSKIRSKLGFRSLSRSSTKKPSHSKVPTLRKEEETVVGEEKGGRSDHTTLKEKEGELADKKKLIGGSNVKNGESKLDDLPDSLSDESVKGKSKRTGKKQVHDAGMRNREKEDSTSSPFQIESGKEEIKMAMGEEHAEKEKPTSIPPPNESREKEIKRVSAVLVPEEEEEQGHDYIAKEKEDSKTSYFPLESGTEEIKMTREGEKQAGDRRDGGKEQSISSAFPEEIPSVVEEKQQVDDTKIKGKEEDSTSSPFTIKSGGEGIKMIEEVEEQNGGRRERGKEEPPPAPSANGIGGEEITRERGGEEQAHDSILLFGQKEDSTSSRFPTENGKEENKVTEKGQEQDGENRDRGKEESISSTLPNESGGEEIKRMKEPTSLLPIESGPEEMKRMDEGLEQGVDMRTREKEVLTSSPLQDKSGWTAMKRMSKREEHAIDRREKEKEDSASSPLRSESGREETNWVSKGEEQAGGGRNQDKEDSTSSPPSLMSMPKSEEVPLGEQHLSSLPSDATADQERKISETREGQTSDQRHQIKEDSVLFPVIPVLESKAIDVGDKMPQTAVSSSPKQIIEEGWRLEGGDKAPETKEGGAKAEHIASPPAVVATSSGEDIEAAGSSIEKPKFTVTGEGEEILKDHKELEMKPFLVQSESKEEIKRTNEGQLVPRGDFSSWKKEDSMPMLATKLREADTSLYPSSVSTTEEEEERSGSKSMAAERAKPSSSPVSAPTSGEDVIGESDRMEHKGIRSKEENRKISKIIQEEITSVGERQAQWLLEHEMLMTLGNGSITTTLLAAIKETIHKEIEELRSTLFSAKEELKGQVEGGEMICRKTHLKIKESDEEGRERDELSSREKLRPMPCPCSTPTAKEKDPKKSDVEGKSSEKTQVPRRDGKAPKEIEGREVVKQMRDGEDERNVASPSHTPKPTDEEKTSLGKEQEQKGGASYWSSSGKALGVFGVAAAITSIGTVVLLKRLENVRRHKHK